MSSANGLFMKFSLVFFGMIFVCLGPVTEETSFAQNAPSRSESSAASLEQPRSSSVKDQGLSIEELDRKIEDFKQNELAEKRSLMGKIFVAGVLMLIGFALFILLKYGLRKFEEFITEKEAIRESEMTLRFKTLVRLFHWVGSIAILGAVLYMVLENFGVNVAPLLAGAGIVGVAFGFGGQYLIRDLINGIFILLEGHYSVNDIVEIGEYAGVVENINLRITVLRDAEGRVIVIPNGDVKTVVNLTKDYSRAVLTVGVAYKENVDRVMEVIKRLGREIREDPYFGRLILEDMEMWGVDDFAESQVSIKFRIKTLPSKQFEVARELRRRIKNLFDELGIEIPCPHRTIYLGSGKENEWFRDSVGQRASQKG
jgi:small conductance mechanosensitive channel